MREELEQREIEYTRGKTAGHDVRDDENNLIVARGQTITDELIHRVQEEGKLHYLMLSAAASVVQAGGEDARARLEEFRGVAEGHEAEFIRDKPVGRDVRDLEGNILIRKGDMVTTDVIEQAEKQGLLQDLVLAVGAVGIHAEEEMEEMMERPAAKMGYTPYSE